MRTVTIVPLGTIAVLTKNTESIWKAIADKPEHCSRANACFLAMLVPAAIDMVNAQKLKCLLSATSTSRRIAAVMLKYLHSVFKTSFCCSLFEVCSMDAIVGFLICHNMLSGDFSALETTIF